MIASSSLLLLFKVGVAGRELPPSNRSKFGLWSWALLDLCGNWIFRRMPGIPHVQAMRLCASELGLRVWAPIFSD